MSGRELVPELMDDPSLNEAQHLQALAGLKRINFFSGTSSRLANVIANSTRSEHLQILDLASGGGDVALRLYKKLNGRGIQAKITGRDISPNAVRHANQQSEIQNLSSHVHFEVAEAIDGLENNAQKFDFIYCSLFLHHLTREDSIRVLKAMKLRASQGVIIDDLLRDSFGYILAQVGCRLLSRSSIVHFDGPQSVKAAYNRSEALELACIAGLENAQITCHWPKRFCMVWLCNALKGS